MRLVANLSEDKKNFEVSIIIINKSFSLIFLGCAPGLLAMVEEK